MSWRRFGIRPSSFALIGTGRRFAVLKQVNSQKYLKHSGETPVATNDAGASDRGPVAGRMGGVNYCSRSGGEARGLAPQMIMFGLVRRRPGRLPVQARGDLRVAGPLVQICGSCLVTG